MSDRFFSSQIVMSYDDFTIYSGKGRFYAEREAATISEVFLTQIIGSSEYNEDPVILYGDYDGETDNQMWIMSFSLNPSKFLKVEGMRKIQTFLVACAKKRIEILDAGMDTVDDTKLPTMEDIERDIKEKMSRHGEYLSNWKITDNYESETLCLKQDTDFFLEKYAEEDVADNSEEVKEILQIAEIIKDKLKDAEFYSTDEETETSGMFAIPDNKGVYTPLEVYKTHHPDSGIPCYAIELYDENKNYLDTIFSKSLSDLDATLICI